MLMSVLGVHTFRLIELDVVLRAHFDRSARNLQVDRHESPQYISARFPGAI